MVTNVFSFNPFGLMAVMMACIKFFRLKWWCLIFTVRNLTHFYWISSTEQSSRHPGSVGWRVLVSKGNRCFLCGETLQHSC